MTNGLSVPVIGSLTLDAGACCVGDNAITILPPSVTMFDQLLDWLSRKAAPDRAVFGAPSIGIGRDSVLDRVIADKNARIGHEVHLVNEAGVEHADGQGYYIRNGIIIVPRGAVVPDGTRA